MSLKKLFYIFLKWGRFLILWTFVTYFLTASGSLRANLGISTGCPSNNWFFQRPTAPTKIIRFQKFLHCKIIGNDLTSMWVWLVWFLRQSRWKTKAAYNQKYIENAFILYQMVNVTKYLLLSNYYFLFEIQIFSLGCMILWLLLVLPCLSPILLVS